MEQRFLDAYNKYGRSRSIVVIKYEDKVGW